MKHIKENFTALKREVPEDVTIVAVSKTKPREEIMEVYDTGHRIYGESKAQELTAKYKEMPQDIQWHMIGHLQTNKVKYIAPFVQLIHSADSTKVIKTINKEAHKSNRVINCLIQIHIADEESKYGFNERTAEEMINSEAFKQWKNIHISGVMGMATFTNDTTKIEKEFKRLRKFFEYLKSGYFKNKDSFKEISMGMSNDYRIAIDQGSTMIRVGSNIFGKRNYT